MAAQRTQEGLRTSDWRGKTLSRQDEPVHSIWWECSRPGEDKARFPLVGLLDPADALPAAQAHRRQVYCGIEVVTVGEEGVTREPLAEPRSYREDEGVYVLVGPDGEDVAVFQPERVRGFR